jgi:hypothetical protein
MVEREVSRKRRLVVSRISPPFSSAQIGPFSVHCLQIDLALSCCFKGGQHLKEGETLMNTALFGL